MPRRKPPRPDTRPDGGSSFFDATSRIEDGPAGERYQVRTVPGARATKVYRCPGCDHEIRPGVAHLVAWPVDEIGGADERRHWHTGCWSGRGTRGLTRRWS